MADKKEVKIKKIAVIRVRGKRGLKPKISLTTQLLRLFKPNHCVVIDDTPSYRGMLLKAKDYLTWGEISEQTFAKMLYKRGEVGSKKFKEVFKEQDAQSISKDFFSGKIKLSDKNISPVFRLNPPGENRSLKRKFTVFGRLGERSKEDIETLLKNMV